MPRNGLMVMVSNHTSFEMGYLAARHPGRIGHLYSPGAQRGPWQWMPYALDNGAYGAFTSGAPWDEHAWRELLRWAALSGQRPLWAIVPDVVADRKATLDQWACFAPEVRAFGFRPALALQDGMTFDDVPDADCILFLGGSTKWKDEAIEPWCKAFPGRVHVGRVNRWDRLVRCWRAGAVSVDGTGWYHKQNGQRAELVRFLRETDDGAGDEWHARAVEVHESLHGVYDETPVNRHNVAKIAGALRHASKLGVRDVA